MRIGEEEISFAGPGQRDHSWSARDWWAVDWMWSGLHLDDGTHTHAVAIPQMPGMGVGYVQREGELRDRVGKPGYELADNGLITRAGITPGPTSWPSR